MNAISTPLAMPTAARALGGPKPGIPAEIPRGEVAHLTISNGGHGGGTSRVTLTPKPDGITWLGTLDFEQVAKLASAHLKNGLETGSMGIMQAKDGQQYMAPLGTLKDGVFTPVDVQVGGRFGGVLSGQSTHDALTAVISAANWLDFRGDATKAAPATNPWRS